MLTSNSNSNPNPNPNSGPEPSGAPTASEQNNNSINLSNHFKEGPARAPQISSGHNSLTSSLSNSSTSSFTSARSLGGSRDAGSGGKSKAITSNENYDHIRNTTLMFFLDRLYMAANEGQEARTLHDLSCLFGTKDFTKEMRQIVGASRNGLKKFLQSYPSLFTIDGDKVYLSQFRQDSSQCSVRDYHSEAVDYFKLKLLQFGTSLVPIRNLFGYRSQASQEVRHVSGKSTKDFKQFLLEHDDVFELLPNEHVVLKSVLNELKLEGKLESTLSSLKSISQTQCGNSIESPSSCPLLSRESQENESENKNSSKVQPKPNGSELKAALMDPYLNKQFAHFIENLMKTFYGDQLVTIQCLIDKIRIECKNELFLQMIKTIEDFKIFLRMHPKIFKRVNNSGDMKSIDSKALAPSEESDNNSEFVCLLSEEERREFELTSISYSHPQPQQQQQHSTLKRCDTKDSQISCDDQASRHQQPMSMPPFERQSSNLVSKRVQLRDQPEAAGSTLRGHQKASIQLNSRRSSNAETTSSQFAGADNDQDETAAGGSGYSSLRATAPPFVPATRGFNAPRGQQTQRPSSNSNHQQPTSLHSYHSQQQHQTLNYQAKNQLNNSLQHQAKNNQQQIQRSYSIMSTNPATGSGGGAQKTNNQFAYHRQHSNLAANVFQQQQQDDDLRTRTVNIVREASSIISKIMTTTDAVAFDCKGYNLGFNGKITLIQLGYLPNMQTSSNQHPHRLLSGANELGKENNDDQSNSKGPNGKGQKPEVCIFDLITNPELAYCLKPLLESDKIVKIVQDVRNKSNALFVQFEIMLSNVFDTQVANLVIQQQETGKPAYKSRYISMSKLCEIYGNESLIKYRSLILGKTRHSTTNSLSLSSGNSSKLKDVNYWKTRPLTQAMLHECTMDVYCLIGGVYQNLKSRIKPEYEPLFKQLNLEGVLARIKPDEIRSVKKERKIDLEVIDLKRKLYSELTSNIVLSNREIRLLRHIDLSPEVRQKIQQCKKVAKKLERLDMKAAQMAAAASGSTTAPSLNGEQSSLTNSNGELSMDGASIQTCASTTSGSSSTTTSSSSSNSTTPNAGGNAGCHGAQNKAIGESASNDLRALLLCSDGDVDGTGIGNLMDGSMFDELKDKMIESSSLLKSLEDDEEDEVAKGVLIKAQKDLEKTRRKLATTEPGATNSAIPEPAGDGGHNENCHCNCHHKDGVNHSTEVAAAAQDQAVAGEKQQVESNEGDEKRVEVSCDPERKLKETTSGQPGTSQSMESWGRESSASSSASSKAVDMAVQCDLLG